MERVASNANTEFAARAKLSYIAFTPFKENLKYCPAMKWERRVTTTSIALPAQFIIRISVIDKPQRLLREV